MAPDTPQTSAATPTEIRLETIAGQVRRWLEWHRTHREKEHLTTDGDTAIRALPVPMWPNHAQLEAWIAALDEARAIKAELVAALEPFAKFCDELVPVNWPDFFYITHRDGGTDQLRDVTVGDFRRARSALSRAKGERT